MAVSKIAVIALVVIVVAPILLGYAMAVEENTETGYQEENYTNVTPLLQNSSTFDRSQANAYSLNSNVFSPPSGSENFKFFPNYLSTTSARSPIVAAQDQSRVLPYTLSFYRCYTFQGSVIGSNYTSANHVYADFYDDNNTLIRTVHGFRYCTYEEMNNKTVVYAYQYDYVNPANLRYDHISNVHHADVKIAGSGSWSIIMTWNLNITTDEDKSNANEYVNLSKGYNLNVYNNGHLGVMPRWWWPDNYVDDVIYTIDLSTTANSTLDYVVYWDDPDNPEASLSDCEQSRLLFRKVNGEWGFYNTFNYGDDPLYKLYYDPAQPSNTYQLKITKTSLDIRYIGSWPSQVAEANYYRSWNYEYENPIDSSYSIRGISLYPVDDLTMRFDAATYRSYSYKITEDYTYDPSSLIGDDNIVTKLENVVRPGTSINFGGNTYTISKNNLILGTHKIPISGIKFESTLNDDNTYDNKINGTIISTTATPSDITFNGKWRMQVSSAPLSVYTYSTTEWVPGEFGWNGMDHNFLMVGLITSLGAFVGVGIYARRTKSSVWPLLIVCGGAALLFFVML